MPKPSTRSRNPRAKEFPPAKSVLVTIHGAGAWPANYAQHIVEVMQKDSQKKITCFPAWYGVMRFQGLVESPKTKAWLEKLQVEFERAKSKRGVTQSRLPFGSIPVPGNINALVMLKHVAAYLGDETYARRLRKILRDQLKLAKATAKPIVLVSHSLGTLVAFDVLRKLDKTYPIVRWYTCGCPLDKLVNLHARTDRLGHISSLVARWDNLFDPDDWVADSLSRFKFPIKNHRVEVGPHLPQAHDYYNNAESLAWFADAFLGKQNR